MSQGGENESGMKRLKLASVPRDAGGGRTMAFLNRSSSRILGSRQLWNRGAQNSPRKRHRSTLTSGPAVLAEDMSECKRERKERGNGKGKCWRGTTASSVGCLQPPLQPSCCRSPRGNSGLFNKKEAGLSKAQSQLQLH